MAYLDFQTLVTDLVRDDEARISVDQRNAAIDRAAIRYSTDRPQTKVVDVAAAGGNALQLPASWEAGFSALISIEYPIGMNPPSWLDRDIYRLYDKTDGTQEIRFDRALPNANVRLCFSIKQSLTSGAPGTDTIPIADRMAVCQWAAADLCDQLAALYSNTQDSTIQADAVQYQSKASQRRSQATAYRKQYLDFFGIDEKQNEAAGVAVAIPLYDSVGGQRIFHGRRTIH
jgi:hypothetical protein